AGPGPPGRPRDAGSALSGGRPGGPLGRSLEARRDGLDLRRQPDHLDGVVPLPPPPRFEASQPGERIMKSKGFYVVGGALLLGFIGFSLLSFKQTLTPYVSYEQARSANRMVQVAGALEKGSSAYQE